MLSRCSRLVVSDWIALQPEAEPVCPGRAEGWQPRVDRWGAYCPPDARWTRTEGDRICQRQSSSAPLIRRERSLRLSKSS